MGVEPTCAAPNDAQTVLKTAATTGPQPPPHYSNYTSFCSIALSAILKALRAAPRLRLSIVLHSANVL